MICFLLMKMIMVFYFLTDFNRILLCQAIYVWFILVHFILTMSVYIYFDSISTCVVIFRYVLLCESCENLLDLKIISIPSWITCLFSRNPFKNFWISAYSLVLKLICENACWLDMHYSKSLVIDKTHVMCCWITPSNLLEMPSLMKWAIFKRGPILWNALNIRMWSILYAVCILWPHWVGWLVLCSSLRGHALCIWPCCIKNVGYCMSSFFLSLKHGKKILQTMNKKHYTVCKIKKL